MAPDDRDRTFEKALSRHLRSSASPSAGPKGFDVSSRESCPDPETLAAYHDGSLSPEERVLWKQHVVDCENCQLVLAHLETPLEIPVHVADKQSVAASQRPASAAPVAPPAVIARPRRPPSMRWLWLVPAGAAAAGLIAWISLNQQKPLPLTQPAPVEVAENRTAPSAAPASGADARVAPPEHKALQNKEPQNREKDQARHSVGGLAPTSSTARDDAAKTSNNRAQLTQQAPSPYSAGSAALSHGPSLSAQKQQQQQGSSFGRPTGASVLDQKKSAAATSPKPQPSTNQAAPSVSAPAEPSFLAEDTVTPPPAVPPAPSSSPPAATGAAGDAGAAKAGNTVSVSTMNETVEVVSPSELRKSLRLAALQDPHVFGAPDRKHFWRVGPVGLLEFSGNKGDKWKPQVSAVTTDLVAGFAPSAKVAWVVGRSGTILRTTDGGVLWIKLTSPEPGDLAGVIATDAMNAKVWFVPDEETHVSKTYQTTDGGATWSMVLN
ncbi:MAG: YCF48-related protein [Candidatus Acidiferrum sp.]